MKISARVQNSRGNHQVRLLTNGQAHSLAEIHNPLRAGRPVALSRIESIAA